MLLVSKDTLLFTSLTVEDLSEKDGNLRLEYEKAGPDRVSPQ